MLLLKLCGSVQVCRCGSSDCLSGHSKLDSDVWQCEFCETKNSVHLDEEELPSAEDTLDYLLCPSEARPVETSVETIIFVVDISGKNIRFVNLTLQEVCVSQPN
jgi:hypothetical protein